MSAQKGLTQIGDLDPALLDNSSGFDASKFTGRWKNTNANSHGIVECLITPKGQRFIIQTFGAGVTGSIVWPPGECQVLANLEEEAGQRTGALAATIQFGYMELDIYVRVNKGVLVIVLYVTFLDESGRSDYVNREFFYRTDV